ncbi:hypothetical protein D3C86_1191200 [compost metagenome]
MRRRHGNAVIDDDGFDFSVQYRGQDGIFETAHQHRLVNQPVVGAPQVTQFLAYGRRARRRHGRHQQHFEVGRPRGLPAQAGQQVFLRIGGRVIRGLPFTVLVTVAARQHGVAHAKDQARRAHRVVFRQAFFQGAQQMRARIRKVAFHGQQISQCLLHGCGPGVALAAARFARPGLRFCIHFAPPVQTRSGV